MDIKSLNDKYHYLSPLMRMEKLFNDFESPRVLATSSFGTSSVVLLHLISKVNPGHPIYFIDTGYHFEQTIQYKQQLQERLKLNVIDINAPENRHNFTKKHKTYQFNQDLCCHINKVMPVDELKANHDLWISGVLRYQNANRAKMKIFEEKPDIVKFNVLLDMTQKEVELYKYINELPEHPLLPEGYHSVGCENCTVKGIGREGRWVDSFKAECGLHA